VSQSAYLLFYRRRSDGPLGGPRFQEILTNFDNSQDPSEDELAGSGEDQGLVGNSSLRGSSSALTGVEAARHQASRGLGRIVKPHDIEGLPAYKAHEENDEDAAPLLLRDAEMNDGLPINSIEDEAIDMGINYNNIGLSAQALQSSQAIGSNWTFQGLEGLNREQNFISGTGSEVDVNDDSGDDFDSDRSDIVQHNSSASSNSIRNRMHDFDNTPAEGDGEDGMFEDPSPVPDIDDDDERIDTLALHRDILQPRDAPIVQPEFKVTPRDAAEEVEEPATEIHVEEDEDLKID
jgi:ubiquitin carboxyl-terminal hydrolase 4/11/15